MSKFPSKTSFFQEIWWRLSTLIFSSANDKSSSVNMEEVCAVTVSIFIQSRHCVGCLLQPDTNPCQSTARLEKWRGLTENQREPNLAHASLHVSVSDSNSRVPIPQTTGGIWHQLAGMDCSHRHSQAGSNVQMPFEITIRWKKPGVTESTHFWSSLNSRKHSSFPLSQELWVKIVRIICRTGWERIHELSPVKLTI